MRKYVKRETVDGSGLVRRGSFGPELLWGCQDSSSQIGRSAQMGIVRQLFAAVQRLARRYTQIHGYHNIHLPKHVAPSVGDHSDLEARERTARQRTVTLVLPTTRTTAVPSTAHDAQSVPVSATDVVILPPHRERREPEAERVEAR